MLRVPVFLLLLLSAASIPEIFRDYRLMREGCASFERHSYPVAEAKFLELLRLNPQPVDSRAAAFNLACTWYMQGKYPQASSLFTRWPEQRDLKLKSMFNQGNTLAMTAFASGDKNRKLQLFKSSLHLFRTVLLQDPGDGDAKINYEIVRRYIEELEQPPPAGSSGPGAGSGSRGQAGPNGDVADRLLQKAMEDESSLMRQIPGQKKTEAGRKNDKDW
ncbi:MAG: tetratricopeptide repeat protein [Chlorobiaceae bacterium]|nr:tetratricopeptide repeat protein [Chlorobiaceae bacterium]NTV61203.1 tetratricopeptide repeat protein [Chlorobiaceae bacterium]